VLYFFTALASTSFRLASKAGIGPLLPGPHWYKSLRRPTVVLSLDFWERVLTDVVRTGPALRMICSRPVFGQLLTAPVVSRNPRVARLVIETFQRP
jgi:hypothetical protein